MLGVLWTVVPLDLPAQQTASVREYQKEYTTYPYSDPDPVPGRIYPYFRYEGFTHEPEKKEWKIVELENAYIKLQITPEIGGKIWTAIDKQSGKPFLYENSVVKFRDIALRGPWTSGGLEPNYGIIGHTPNCATPVDYLTRKNSDGSVSCIIGVLDLLTRSRWTLEINLPPDKAYFTTRSFWHNSGPLVQPYYTWMNAAVKASGELEFIYPGTHYIGHNGKASPWPLDTLRQRNLAFYGQNNFIGSKSYHVLGTAADYFGAYWRSADLGMICYAGREEKLGKKIYLWALSDEGKLWEELLTDDDGQYVEIQSGRLFNQNLPQSSSTPFKQVGFSPYQSDTWTEYWFPFKNTGGAIHAGLNGVMNVRQEGDICRFSFSPVRPVSDSLQLYDSSGRLVYKARLDLQPLEVYHQDIRLDPGQKVAGYRLNGRTVDLYEKDSTALSRPVDPPAGFDPDSAYGLYLQGRDLGRFRNYFGAEKMIRQSLEKDGTFIPALVEMSGLKYRKMQYDSAFYYAHKALSIDTYDPAANYFYGLAAVKLGKKYDAMDGFQVAVLTHEFRLAAYTELSRLYLKEGDYVKAGEYARKSLSFNRYNTEGLQLAWLSARLLGREDRLPGIKKKILEYEPLNHFIRFEEYLRNPNEAAREAFSTLIRNELPQETYLELAVWYYNLGRMEECREVLALAPENSEILFWRAYLHRDEPDAGERLDAANKSPAYLVYPFRAESAKIMQWAMQQNGDWKPCYYLALIHSFRNNKQVARNILDRTDAGAAFSPFYVTRALLYNKADSVKKLRDFSTAVQIDPESWRNRKYLTEYFLEQGRFREALNTIQEYAEKVPENHLIGLLTIRCLIVNNRYKEAEKMLEKINVLPHEGAMEGHTLYKETKLMLGLEALANKQYKQALAKVREAGLWPHRLGAGKPYEEMIDTRLEDWLYVMIYDALGNEDEKKRYLHRILDPGHDLHTASTLVQILALGESGQHREGEALFDQWIKQRTSKALTTRAKDLYRKSRSRLWQQDEPYAGYGFLYKTISAKRDVYIF